MISNIQELAHRRHRNWAIHHTADQAGIRSGCCALLRRFTLSTTLIWALKSTDHHGAAAALRLLDHRRRSVRRRHRRSTPLSVLFPWWCGSGTHPQATTTCATTRTTSVTSPWLNGSPDQPPPTWIVQSVHLYLRPLGGELIKGGAGGAGRSLHRRQWHSPIVFRNGVEIPESGPVSSLPHSRPSSLAARGALRSPWGAGQHLAASWCQTWPVTTPHRLTTTSTQRAAG